MKKIIRLIAIITCFALCVCSFVGCNQPTDPSSSKEPEFDVVVPEDDDSKDDIYFTRNFSTSYQIVVPENRTNIIDTAASELSSFLYSATGSRISVIEDSGLNYDESQKYLSLGNTSILGGSSITNSYDTLGESGYKLSTKGKQIIISAATDVGVLYGVYRFLKYTIGFEAYALDTVDYDTNSTTYVYNFNDYVHIPSIQLKNHGSGDMRNPIKMVECARMGLISSYWLASTFEGQLFGAGLTVHTTFTVLSPSVYYAQNPTWYYAINGTPKQLCLSNEAMITQFTANLIEKIQGTPTSLYYMLGCEDNPSACNCDTCIEQGLLYGGNAGIYCRFLNKVTDSVNAWIKANQPEREGRVFICGLAYFGNVTPPTKLVGGEHVPVHESVILRDNIYMEYVTHDDCQSHSFDDPTCSYNKTSYQKLVGWSKIAKNMMIYTYDTNFACYFLPYNNFGALQGNLKVYEELGVKYVYNSGAGGPGSFEFDPLRTYLFSKLCDDTDQDMNLLTDKFFDAYFGDASDVVGEYYASFRSNVAMVTKNKSIPICMGIYTYQKTDFSHKDYWSYDFLKKTEQLFAEGYAKIEQGNSPTKELDKQHLMSLELSNRYLMIRYYENYFSDTAFVEYKQSFLDDCEKLGIVGSSLFDQARINFENGHV